MATLFSPEQFHAAPLHQSRTSQVLALRQLIYTIFLSVPVVGPVIWLIWARTPDVPVADEWQIVDLVGKFDSGMLGMDDLWSDWNGHRVVLPRVVLTLLAEGTLYNRQVMMTINIAIVVVTAILLLRCMERTSASAPATITYAIPLSLLLFSLGQFENWMNPFQLAFIATTFGVVLCMWGIVMFPARPRGLLVAMVGGVITSFSSLAGLMVWGLFLPILWVFGFRRRWQYALWVAVAALIVLPYRVGLSGVSVETGVSRDLGDVVQYFLAFLGAPVGWPDISHAQLFALVGFALFALDLAVYRRLGGDWRSLAVWLALACFALGCAALTAVGRVSFGINQALQSRYQSLAVLWWIALAALIWLTTLRLRGTLRVAPRSLRGAGGRAVLATNLLLTVVLVLALVQQNLAGFRAGDTWLVSQIANQRCVLNYMTAPDACIRVFLPPDSLRTRAAYLDRRNMAIFANNHPVAVAALPVVNETPLYSIDAVSQTPVKSLAADTFPIAFGAPVILQGWAVDGPRASLAGAVFVSIDGGRDVLADYGGDRPDVAEYHRTPAYRYSGFAVQIPTANLAPGDHTLVVKIVDRTLRSYAATQPVRIVVTPLREVPYDPRTTRSVASAAGVEQAPPDQTRPIAIPPKSPVIISGWAIDERAGGPASGVVFTVDGATDYPADYGLDRPDVALFWQNPAYRNTGYVLSIPAARLGPGTHTITMKVIRNGARAYDDPAWSVVVVIPAV